MAALLRGWSGGEAAAVGGRARRRAGGRTRGACVSTVPKPQRRATASMARRSSRARGARARRAAPRRSGGRHAGLGAERAGEVARAHARAPRRARPPTGRRRGGRRSTPAARAAARASARCAASCALNCDWPPGRRRNSTSQRATVERDARGRGPPRRARARGPCPAVTPADVQTLPSRDEDRVGLDVDARVAARRARRTTPSASSRGGRRAGRPRRARTRRCRPSATRRAAFAARGRARRPPARAVARTGAAGDDQRVERPADVLERGVRDERVPEPVSTGAPPGATTSTA